VRHWRELPLNELGFVGRGRSTHRPRDDDSLYGGMTPFFQTGDVKAANFWLREHSQTYNEKGLAQSKLWASGTLCITIAANIAESAVLAISAAFPDSVVGFIPDTTRADVRFVKYALDTLRTQMQSVSRGTTQDNLSLDKLLGFRFPAPPLEEQQRIAGILSAYDDLIENCERRIRVLDEMARALYCEWFVLFRYPGHEKIPLGNSPIGQIPRGWQRTPLSAVADINARRIDLRHPPSRLLYVDISSVSPGKIDSMTEYAFADAPGRARRVLRHGDVLWSCVRPNRRSYALVLHPDDAMIASTGFAVLSARQIPYCYLYAATTTDEFVGYLEKRATGAAYPAVTAKVFEDAPLLIPSASVMERFAATMNPRAETIAVLQRQIDNLRKTRDLLLPRLLSGQLLLEAPP
jgi:type I restriction enzyme, S subunit